MNLNSINRFVISGMRNLAVMKMVFWFPAFLGVLSDHSSCAMILG